MISLSTIGSLDNLAQNAAFFVKILEPKLTVAICDTEKFIKYIPGEKIKLPIKEGMPVGPDEPLRKCMVQKKDIKEDVPEFVLGVPFQATAYPIVDGNGKVVGGIGIGRPMDVNERLKGLSADLHVSLEGVVETVNDIAENAQQISASQQAVSDSAKRMHEQIKDTEAVLSFIKGIATQTNMLGINAAIEAARAGTHGRGFSVVAEEVRKLSADSSDAVQKIATILETAIRAAQKIVSEVAENNEAIQKQAAATEEINSTIEDISRVSDLLVNLSKEI